MKNRIACTALTGRIMLGRVSKSGLDYVGDPVDVTSDVLKAIIDKLEFHGDSMPISCDGKVIATITLTKVQP